MSVPSGWVRKTNSDTSSKTAWNRRSPAASRSPRSAYSRDSTIAISSTQTALGASPTYGSVRPPTSAKPATTEAMRPPPAASPASAPPMRSRRHICAAATTLWAKAAATTRYTAASDPLGSRSAIVNVPPHQACAVRSPVTGPWSGLKKLIAAASRSTLITVRANTRASKPVMRAASTTDAATQTSDTVVRTLSAN